MTRNEKRLLLGCAGVGLAAVAGSIVLVAALFAVLLPSRNDRAASVSPAPPAVQVAPSESTSQSAPASESTTSGSTANPGPIGSHMTREQQRSGNFRDLPLPASQSGTAPDLADLFRQVSPGVVSISIRRSVSFGSQQAVQAADGSGFIFNDTDIVTNNHVVEGADQVIVTFEDLTQEEATVVSTDAFADLAVVRVASIPGSARPLPLAADFGGLEVGQPVIAIGNPFGLANSMTYGIISSLGRTIPSQATQFSIPETIQTDAAINPGNSGGPLLDVRGEVIGVNAQIQTNGPAVNSGVGFAIPSSIVAKVVPELVAGNSYDWSYLGVTGTSLDLEIAQQNNLDITRGAIIDEVITGGPADGKLQGGPDPQAAVGGDVIVAVDGIDVHSFDDLLSYVALETVPGQSVAFTFLRDGKQQTVEVTLGHRPAPSSQPDAQPLQIQPFQQQP